MRSRSIWIAIAFACCAPACGGKRAATPEVTPALKAEATKLFADRCARCHGLLGKGDGPEAKTLSPRPRNFADPSWQLAVPDALLEKVIVHGGPATGKSTAMPAHPDLASRPALLVALRQYLRELAANVDR